MFIAQTTIFAAAFVMLVGFLFGSTIAPSPRGGAQPVEFMDEAYYSALAADLNRNGIESITGPSGFDRIEGLPDQVWYHWGEIWTAAAVIRVSGLDPLLARHYVVLPLLLLAAAALTGTLVRRLARTQSRRAFLFGAAASTFLAPLQLLSGSFFAQWPVGLAFGITMYGLGAIAALLSLYVIAEIDLRRSSPALSLFSGTVIASLVPTHLIIALLAIAGAGGALLFNSARFLLDERRLPSVPPRWTGVLIVAVTVGSVSVVWGLLTGHELGASGTSALVNPFNQSWVISVTSVALTAGAFYAIPIAWYVSRDKLAVSATVFIGTISLIVCGAIAWGARLGDFNMFHVFFAGMAVFGAPVAAVAIWALWTHLRDSGRLRLATALLVVTGVQLEFGIVPAIVRLQVFGPGVYQPIPLSILAAIRELPDNAKLAYSCGIEEEFAFWTPRLVSVYAHTGRPVVPMCFEVDVSSGLNGVENPEQVENPLFRQAPQRTLFANATTVPSTASIQAFMRGHGIGYIYADDAHPNRLVPDSRPIAAEDDIQVLEIP
jgi:hypothetical protein